MRTAGSGGAKIKSAGTQPSWKIKSAGTQPRWKNPALKEFGVEGDITFADCAFCPYGPAGPDDCPPKKILTRVRSFWLCPTDAASKYSFTTPGFKFILLAHNFLAAMGRLRLFDARLNDGVVDFDMSSPDPQRRSSQRRPRHMEICSLNLYGW